MNGKAKQQSHEFGDRTNIIKYWKSEKYNQILKERGLKTV
jgi:hypothetical protein